MELEQDESLLPNGFIYLKAKPETCIQRLRSRWATPQGAAAQDAATRAQDGVAPALAWPASQRLDRAVALP